jgi:nitrite reductase/ring-hydroxylating ferredoxin subunit
MKKFTKNKLVNNLKQEGLCFSEFSLFHEGEYALEDADWNYKDVPHLHFVHELAEAFPAVVGDDIICTINLQKVLGLRFPLALVNYESAKNTQTYYSTWLFYVLIIETSYESITPTRTRVNTTYTFGHPKFLKFTFPILKWILKRNYDNLMSTDIPMRVRRGALRKKGYRFLKDGPSYSFEKTMDVTLTNVIIPPSEQAPNPTSIILKEVLPNDGDIVLGEDNHFGLRVIRSGNQLSLFQRMCLHEGASLDGQKCTNGTILCPWHGRAFKPLAIFDTSVLQPQVKNIDRFTFRLDSGELMISYSVNL